MASNSVRQHDSQKQRSIRDFGSISSRPKSAISERYVPTPKSAISERHSVKHHMHHIAPSAKELLRGPDQATGRGVFRPLGAVIDDKLGLRNVPSAGILKFLKSLWWWTGTGAAPSVHPSFSRR